MDEIVEAATRLNMNPTQEEADRFCRILAQHILTEAMRPILCQLIEDLTS